MTLRYLVPSMGLLVASAAPVMAADIGGGLTVDGYVDTILEISSLDENIALARNGNADDDTEFDFSAGAQLEVGYQVGSNVGAVVELFWGDGDGASAGMSNGTGAVLEQGFIAWDVSDNVQLTFGKFHNWIGWEGRDRPELWRVNFSNMNMDATNGARIWGTDTVGIGLAVAGSEQFGFGFYLVDSVYGDDDAPAFRGAAALAAGADGKMSDDFAIGADLTFTADGIGVFDLDLAYEMAGSVDEDGDEAGVFGISFNGEINALSEDNGLTFAWDLNFTDWDFATTLGFMVAANYEFEASVPMSLTLMLDYLDPNDDDDLGGEDDEAFEIAVALLTNPTDDENFALNFEARYIDRGADDANEFGVFANALALIP